jgi:energy-coupling factor transport system ATP-binding protein
MTSEPQRPDAIAQWRGVEVHYPFAKEGAVGPVDLSIKRGERVLLLGPSGSGKSTLLLTLTGLIPGSIPAQVEGAITLFDKDVSAQRPWHWATQVAQYFQDADQTLTGMRVEDEIAFALENRAVPAAEIAEKITQAMRRVGLPDAWRTRRSSTLSGGEKQLVALAALLVQEAELFVADEPTAHLAPEAADRLHALLSHNAPDQSVLIVDHRLEGLIEFIDRVVVLGRCGTIIAQGCPREERARCAAA